MKLKLIRTDLKETGIFSDLFLISNNNIMLESWKTLEHAYLQQDNTYKPKVKNGTYICVRGAHKLHDGIPFITFEVEGVVGCSGILFHVGNYNKDSEGCILVGQTTNNENVVLGSKAGFAEFLKSLENVDNIELEVV